MGFEEYRKILFGIVKGFLGFVKIITSTGGPRLVPYLGSQQTALLGKPH